MFMANLKREYCYEEGCVQGAFVRVRTLATERIHARHREIDCRAFFVSRQDITRFCEFIGVGSHNSLRFLFEYSGQVHGGAICSRLFPLFPCLPQHREWNSHNPASVHSELLRPRTQRAASGPPPSRAIFRLAWLEPSISPPNPSP